MDALPVNAKANSWQGHSGHSLDLQRQRFEVPYATCKTIQSNPNPPADTDSHLDLSVFNTRTESLRIKYARALNAIETEDNKLLIWYVCTLIIKPGDKNEQTKVPV